ncbi:hypothetical protein J3J51_00520 [Burkholderia pseudomallei]|nr:hypothetical protein J3B47_06930 [Burkholderia pseudomallei]QTB67367.1 hypothetical protein J3J51_00520 [Burkholderia pseudomallei]
MQLKSTKWPCAGVANHTVVEAIFDEADINTAIAVADAKVAFINAHNPGGILRSREVIKNRIIAGKLADSAVFRMIGTCIEHWNLTQSFKIREYDRERLDGFENPDPYDLELVNLRTNETQTIEVRSSFCYRLAPPSKMIEKLSVYGWYTSANKPVEPPRDWYFQVIYYLRPRDVPSEHGLSLGVFEEQIEAGYVTGYVVGGASRWLLETKGVDRTDQDGASYRAISPACQASDCTQMLNAVFGRNT